MTDSLIRLHELIFSSIAEGVFTVDEEFRITSFNDEAERITGAKREEAIGRKCYEVLRGSICQQGCAMKNTLDTGEAVRNFRVDVLNSSMEVVPIRVTTAVLKDQAGRMLGGVEVFRDVSEVETLRKELKGRHGFSDIIGASHKMEELFQLIPDVASADAPVLIQGASGTGKELVSQAIHDLSPRSDGPFVRVNCGALPDTLLESELFGYRKGAFTDAKRDKPGRFAQAHGGTILLDEIGDVSPAFQVKLLRVLQDHEVYPLGATEGDRVDVRIIASTNRNLKTMVGEGAFREDLFYRLGVIIVSLPPLSERPQDIPLLVEHFIHRFAMRTGKPIVGISPAALEILSDHDYPGNVRELENIVERAFVFCHGDIIEIAHLPKELTKHEKHVAAEDDAPIMVAGYSSKENVESDPEDRSSRWNTPEARKLVAALNTHKWNRTATAKALGIGRNTLWRRMKALGL